MKILGIVCSPRISGNTEILVREALEAAGEEGGDTELLHLSGRRIQPCNHCEACHDQGECCLNDDMVDIYPMLLDADGIILGSPVYFWSVTAQTKLLIDRTYALRYPTLRLQHKVGGGIAVAGRRGHLEALTLINQFFLGQGMIPVSLGVDGRGSKKGDVQNDIRAMKESKQLGVDVIKLLRMLKA